MSGFDAKKSYMSGFANGNYDVKLKYSDTTEQKIINYLTSISDVYDKLSKIASLNNEDNPEELLNQLNKHIINYEKSDDDLMHAFNINILEYMKKKAKYDKGKIINKHNIDIIKTLREMNNFPEL